jgi:hypothetical protein
MNEMRRERHWAENMPPEMYAAVCKLREDREQEREDQLAVLRRWEAVFGVSMFALLSEEVRALKLRVRHGKAYFPQGLGWRPVLIADTEQELEQEIKRRTNVREEKAAAKTAIEKYALQHQVTGATTTLTDSRAT